MLLERLPEVILDPHQRVQPGHRLLEDQPEVGTAEPTQLPVGHADEVPAAVDHLAVGDRSVRQQPEDAPAERRLAATRLADEPDDLARVDVERDAVDGPHRATRRPVVDAQIANRDDRRVGHGSVRNRLGAPAAHVDLVRLRSTGLTVSFSPSPSKVIP